MASHDLWVNFHIEIEHLQTYIKQWINQVYKQLVNIINVKHITVSISSKAHRAFSDWISARTQVPARTASLISPSYPTTFVTRQVLCSIYLYKNKNYRSILRITCERYFYTFVLFWLRRKDRNWKLFEFPKEDFGVPSELVRSFAGVMSYCVIAPASLRVKMCYYSSE